ncbi:MAG: hypothetical protein HY514_00760 [Candidatus Aenigmarchaeota archaeon]|nr:hypothetical protein [Candidatus Aenigmarchaeota archaeon]
MRFRLLPYATMVLLTAAPWTLGQEKKPEKGIYVGKTGICNVTYNKEGGTWSRGISCDEKVGGMTVSRTTIDGNLASIFYHGPDKIIKSIVVLSDSAYNGMKSKNIDVSGYAKESEPALAAHRTAHSMLAREVIIPENHTNARRGELLRDLK